MFSECCSKQRGYLLLCSLQEKEKRGLACQQMNWLDPLFRELVILESKSTLESPPVPWWGMQGTLLWQFQVRVSKPWLIWGGGSSQLGSRTSFFWFVPPQPIQPCVGSPVELRAWEEPFWDPAHPSSLPAFPGLFQLSRDHGALWQCTGEIDRLIQPDLMDLSSNTWINDALRILPQLQPILQLPGETGKSLQPLVLQLKGSRGLSSTVKPWCVCAKMFCYINVCI